MKQNGISKIIQKYLSGRFPSATEEKVQKWIIKNQNSEEKEKASGEYWDQLESNADSGTYKALERVNVRIGYSGQRTFPLYKKITRIAAVFIPFMILAAGGYFYYHSNYDRLAEITVGYGEEQHLFLPDSSQVWLNAGTTIRYSEKFKGKQRRVYLDGEAYFSVKRNENKPFIVETGQLAIKVLGTEFNVKAYSGDKKTITTLTSGKVEVTTGSEISKILKPNEQLIYDKATSALQIAEVLPHEVSGWMAGQLIFSDSSLQEMMQTLERRFNVSIENTTTIPLSKAYTIKFVKNENLDEILSVIEDVAGITCKKNGNKIIMNDK